jgi:hypothetical protein
MIDYEQTEILSESDNVRMPEFVQTSLFPLNPDTWMLFLETLCSGDEWRQGSAVIPSDATQRYLLHAGCSTREEVKILFPLFTERVAPSITSIAATPKVAGD